MSWDGGQEKWECHEIGTGKVGMSWDGDKWECHGMGTVGMSPDGDGKSGNVTGLGTGKVENAQDWRQEKWERPGWDLGQESGKGLALGNIKVGKSWVWGQEKWKILRTGDRKSGKGWDGIWDRKSGRATPNHDWRGEKGQKIPQAGNSKRMGENGRSSMAVTPTPVWLCPGHPKSQLDQEEGTPKSLRVGNSKGWEFVRVGIPRAWETMATPDPPHYSNTNPALATPHTQTSFYGKNSFPEAEFLGKGQSSMRKQQESLRKGWNSMGKGQNSMANSWNSIGRARIPWGKVRIPQEGMEFNRKGKNL